nr:cytochrome c oxidase subunit III [Ficopomatus enigmaticus]
MSNNNMLLLSPWARLSPSPWPMLISYGFGFIFLKMTLWFWGANFYPLLLSVLFVLMVSVFWVRDLIREGMLKGMFTSRVNNGLKWAVWMFILSEAMFFSSFFWAYGHSSLAPSIEFGISWPPLGIHPIHPAALPLFNLGVLVWSSCTLNYSTGLLRVGELKSATIWMGATIFLGFCFVFAQLVEYKTARFSLADGVFGSTFFLLTGFHGFHVMAGMSVLIFNLWRLVEGHYHTGVNLCWMGGVWYWHFVDLIWIGIWFWIYSWGGWGSY